MKQLSFVSICYITRRVRKGEDFMQQQEEKQEQSQQFEWIDEYPSILESINDYYGTCK
jgi:hypothetical protein